MTVCMHAIICMYLYVYIYKMYVYAVYACTCHVCEYVWMYFCIHAILHDILSIQNMTNKCRKWVVYPVYDHFQIRMPTHVNLRYSRAVTNFLNCLHSIYSKLVATFDWRDWYLVLGDLELLLMEELQNSILIQPPKNCISTVRWFIQLFGSW